MSQQNDQCSKDQPLYPCGRDLLTFPDVLDLVVLGATGSIGKQTLDIVKRHPEKMRVVAVSCHSNYAELAHLLDDLQQNVPGAAVPLVAIHDEKSRQNAAELPIFKDVLLSAGNAGLMEAVTAPENAHVLVNGLVGAVGLEPTLAAAGKGMRIALANKESLVVGGDLVKAAVFASNSEILPVDSEHSAMAQCLSGRKPGEISKLILTASGGPFRQTPAADLATVSLEQVLDHPTWNMGPKITVDSATLMNKGLEIIEAHHLFGIPYDRIDVLVHPGSYVHSMVEFIDGAILAQLGTPDMRVPLQYAISGEKHWPLASGRLNLLEVGTLHFEAPDTDRFPCLKLAMEAGAAGGSAPIILNGANEVAVAALLAGQLKYVDIPHVISECLAQIPGVPVSDLALALAIDQQVRDLATRIIDGPSFPNQ
jgi:1-deoxy-D-xylulose-5-phosphate reductoisomerase